MKLADLLTKSEYVECNETESIADYLLKQRVISETQFQNIVSAISRKDQNKKLIEFLQENSTDKNNENININGLFINALRYAGCHYIANILDVDEQVLVFNQDCSGRRKGQVSIHIQVSALQIKAKELLNRQNSTALDCSNQANTIWLDNKQFAPRDKQIVNGAGDNSNSLSKKKPHKKNGCLSFLFCCTFRKRKKHTMEDSSNDKYELDTVNRAKCQVNSEIDKLRQLKIDILTEKSKELYSYLNGSNCTERESLIKYFEQSHKILVFETHFDDKSMVITVICTKKETLTALKDLLQSGQLEKDCNEMLLSKSIFEMLSVKNCKLSVNILPEELNIATLDFDASKRK